MANHWYSRMWVNFYNCFTFHFASFSLQSGISQNFPLLKPQPYIQTSFKSWCLIPAGLPVEDSRFSKFQNYCVIFYLFSQLFGPHIAIPSPIGKCYRLKVGPGSSHKLGRNNSYKSFTTGIRGPPCCHIGPQLFLGIKTTHPRLTFSWFLIPRHKAKQFRCARGCLVMEFLKCWGSAWHYSL